jgi:hypothetical protein
MDWTPSRITVLVAIPFALVLIADGVDSWLERRHGEGNVLVDAAVRFDPRDRVVRLLQVDPDGSDDGVALGPGWTGPVAGGLGVSAEGATLHVRLPVPGVRTVLVEARQPAGRDAARRLRVTVGDVAVGSMDLERTWREAAIDLDDAGDIRGVVILRFVAEAGETAAVRAVGLAAGRVVAIEDIDVDGGLDHDPRGGSVTVSRPGRVVVPVDAAPVPSHLVARARFLSTDGRLPVGRARLVASTAAGSGEPAVRVAAVDFDASMALWRDLHLEAPVGVPLQLVVTVPELGGDDVFRLESVWRRPD